MSDDPRKLGGGISGPGGPYDKDAVVIDTGNAVLLDGAVVAIVGGVRDGVLDDKPIAALTLQGRVNRTTDRVQVLFLMNEDGAAGIITELIGVMSRGGWGQEFRDLLQKRMKEMPL